MNEHGGYRYFRHAKDSNSLRSSSKQRVREVGLARLEPSIRNVTLHADIENALMRSLVEMTSIPLLNMLGVTVDAFSRSNTRSTANYCPLAVK